MQILENAGIGFVVSGSAGVTPKFEYFEGWEVDMFGDDLACLCEHSFDVVPLFVNVKVRDYNRALDLMIGEGDD